MVTLLFLGDIVGRIGRNSLAQILPKLRQEYSPDLVLANGENASGGFGLQPKQVKEILSLGIEVITTGNHVWDKKELKPELLKPDTPVLRPANYPKGNPGRGSTIVKLPSGLRVGVLNLMGRIFVSNVLDCPFQTASDILSHELKALDLILVDFHAETTSEKKAMGYFLDGRVSVVLGTHTHVQTADEQILPQGTAYITDVGMCGAYDSVLGFGAPEIIQRFQLGSPVSFNVAKGRGHVNGIVVRLDDTTGKAIEIKRVNEIVG